MLSLVYVIIRLMLSNFKVLFTKAYQVKITGYWPHSVYCITYSLVQNDHIKRLLLYDFFLKLFFTKLFESPDIWMKGVDLSSTRAVIMVPQERGNEESYLALLSIFILWLFVTVWGENQFSIRSKNSPFEFFF